MMTVVLPYPPSLNRLWRTAGGRTYLSPQAKAYKGAAALLARAAGMRPVSGPVEVEVVLHPRTTKAGAASRRRVDLDNALKAALDALQGVAYLDDAQIRGVAARVGPAVDGGALAVTMMEG